MRFIAPRKGRGEAFCKRKREGGWNNDGRERERVQPPIPRAPSSLSLYHPTQILRCKWERAKDSFIDLKRGGSDVKQCTERDGEGGGGSSTWKKGKLAIVSYNLVTMDENDWGRASPQLLLSSNLVPFLENCTGQRRKIIVHSVSAEILSIANFITLYIYPGPDIMTFSLKS